MRYRPFGRSGVSISNLTLSVDGGLMQGGADGARDLLYAAMETGINAFHLKTSNLLVAEALGRAASALDRDLVSVTMTLGTGDGIPGTERDFAPQSLDRDINQVLAVSGLVRLDLILLAAPSQNELSRSSLDALKAQRSSGQVKLLGVSGDGEVMDAYVSTGAFDVLATPLHANADWMIRSRIRAARERDMAVLAYGYYPEELGTEHRAATLHAPAPVVTKKSMFGFGTPAPKPVVRPKDDPLAGAGTFAFLHRTPNWTPEELCLAYALTDPSVSSVMIEATDAPRLEALAAVPERDLPPGLGALFEMGRVRTAGA